MDPCSLVRQTYRAVHNLRWVTTRSPESSSFVVRFEFCAQKQLLIPHYAEHSGERKARRPTGHIGQKKPKPISLATRTRSNCFASHQFSPTLGVGIRMSWGRVRHWLGWGRRERWALHDYFPPWKSSSDAQADNRASFQAACSKAVCM